MSWKLKGFEDFSKGVFENGGQNLYVSKKGVLQRIWQFDVNKDGHVDLLIANSHGFNEHPKCYIIHDPAGEGRCQEVLTQGAQSGTTADLTGNGIDDLILGVTHDGQHVDLASYVYFGGKDGITENRKIDLAAPACICLEAGDFDGDGKKEIVYRIADCDDCASPDVMENRRLRVYHTDENGFRLNGFRDYPTDVCFFTAADIDGDGCDDLYCRTEDGKWIVLWGGPEGFSAENSTLISEDTQDKARFDLLPSGGGNVRYNEFARSKVLTVGQEQYLFCSKENETRLIHFTSRKPDGKDIVIPEKNIISAAAGNIYGSSHDDLVLLQVNSVDDAHVLIYSGKDGYAAPKEKRDTMTPRDVLLCDFSGNGCDDIAVAQGRNKEAFTTESLLFLNEAGRIAAEPRRFTTHNCVDVKAGDFDGSGRKCLVFVNQQESFSYAEVPVYVYLGSDEGFKPENRLEFPGHSAGCMLPVDFTDNGWPDILLLQNAEDRPYLLPPADLYFGGPEGYDLKNKAEIPADLAWGGHAADLNHDGYMDFISIGKELLIHYGGPDGFKDENMVSLPMLKEGEPGGSGALWPALADLTGNGWLDLIVPYSAQYFSRIFWGGPEGFSIDRSTTLPVDNALCVRVADLNKNGYPDLVFGSRASLMRDRYQEGAVTIFWGGPEGYSGNNCCVLPSYQSNNITIADLNNDGYLDIFASSYFNKKERDINSYIYWNDHGNFSLTNRKRIFSHSSSAAWAGDFNEDGYVDLCVTHHRQYGNHTAQSAIWWNGPEGFREENRTWLPTIGPHDMVANDMGNVMTRGPEEYYITPAGKSGSVKKVSWEAEIQPKTWVNCQIATAATESELEKAAFTGPDGTGASRFESGQEIPASLVKGNYFKVKLYLGAVNSGCTPRVTEINVE